MAICRIGEVQIISQYKIACSIFLVLLGYSVSGFAGEWQLKKDEDGIQIYTRSVEGYSYDAVRSVVQLENTRLSSVVALIRNSKECSEWSTACKSANIIELVNENENYVHTISDLPWPVRDRDVVSHVVWQQDPDTLVVTMEGSATQGKLEENKGIVRLTESHISWELTSMADHSTKVVFDAHINPASLLPGWVTNMLLVDSPFKTMEGLRERVKLEKYQRAALSYIKEPD